MLILSFKKILIYWKLWLFLPMGAVLALLFSCWRTHIVGRALNVLRPARTEFIRPSSIHLNTYIWDRFDVIYNFLASGYWSHRCIQLLKNISSVTYAHLGYFYLTMAFQGLFTCCGSLLLVNSNNYLKLKPFTVFIPFPRTRMALTH